MSWNPRGVVILAIWRIFSRVRSRSLLRVCVKTPAGTRSPPPAAWGHSRPRVASADLARDATTLVMQCISNPAMVRARSLSLLASRAPRRVSAPARRPSLGRVASSLAAPDANPPLRPVPAGRPSRRRDPPPQTRTPRCLRRPRRRHPRRAHPLPPLPRALVPRPAPHRQRTARLPHRRFPHPRRDRDVPQPRGSPRARQRAALGTARVLLRHPDRSDASARRGRVRGGGRRTRWESVGAGRR